MRSSLKNLSRFILVTIGVVLLTSFSIDATDTLRGSQTALGLLTQKMTNESCPEEMSEVSDGQKSFCLDKYEASPSDACLYVNPESSQETQANLSGASCLAESKPGVTPWRFVTYTEAQQLCARSGKRLPTSNEWYKNALSISDPDSCFLNKSLQLTGQNNCYTQNNIADLIGNVWEWSEDVVIEGKISERQLPDSGYVDLVDNVGVVLETSDTPNASFGSDYAWVNSAGVRGILKGGFYGSGKDGGIFSQNASVELGFATAGVGFRCVKDL